LTAALNSITATAMPTEPNSGGEPKRSMLSYTIHAPAEATTAPSTSAEKFSTLPCP